MTFQVPTSFSPGPLENIEDDDEKLDGAPWYFYRSANDQCPAWPGLFATTNREKAKLTLIIHDAEMMLYGSQGQRISAHNVLQLYGRFVAWRKELPDSISNIKGNSSPALPHVLSLL
jgi:hypothetical protein